MTLYTIKLKIIISTTIAKEGERICQNTIHSIESQKFVIYQMQNIMCLYYYTNR